MSDVQVAIGFGRKTGGDGGMLSLRQITFNDLLNKIQTLFFAHVFVPF
jgi:hypothetical protein